MRTYTIHERPDPAADRVDRAEGLVFIKDGFSWAAALFAPLWLIVHRLWWPLLGYVVIGGGVRSSSSGSSPSTSAGWGSPASRSTC